MPWAGGGRARAWDSRRSPLGPRLWVLWESVLSARGPAAGQGVRGRAGGALGKSRSRLSLAVLARSEPFRGKGKRKRRGTNQSLPLADAPAPLCWEWPF